MKSFFLIIIFFLSFNLKGYFPEIKGDAGHISVGFSIGPEIFYYSDKGNSSDFYYLFKNYNYNPIKLGFSINYFSTDFNRYDFFFEANMNVGLQNYDYESFCLGINDIIYIKRNFSFDFGSTVVFEKSYKFLLSFGLSYYLIKDDKNIFVISDYFSIFLNSLGLGNYLYFKWMHIF